MKLKNKAKISVLVLGGAIFFIPQIAVASTVVTVRASDANSLGTGRTPSIPLGAGKTALITFTGLRDTYITSAVVANPSNLVVVPLGGELCPGNPCPPTSAKAISLTRTEGLDIEHFPTDTPTTLLVSTANDAGQSHIYTFTLLPQGGAYPTVVNVWPDRATSSPLPTRRPLAADEDTIAIFRRGIEAADASLPKNSTNAAVLARARQFLVDLEAGFSVEESRDRNDLKPSAIEYLRRAGVKPKEETPSLSTEKI